MASPKTKPNNIMSKREFSLSMGKKFRLIKKKAALSANNDNLIPIMEENIVLILLGSLFFSKTYLAA